jgi:hypothetical protein
VGGAIRMRVQLKIATLLQIHRKSSRVCSCEKCFVNMRSFLKQNLVLNANVFRRQAVAFMWFFGR